MALWRWCWWVRNKTENDALKGKEEFQPCK